MSTFAPVVATISRMTLPPEPMTSRILSTGILMVSMRRGVLAEASRAPDSAFVHFAEDVHAAAFGLLQSGLHDVFVDAGDLDVHLKRW
jgi:hypothetical protein